MKKLLPLVLALVVAYLAWDQQAVVDNPVAAEPGRGPATTQDSRNWRSGQQVTGNGQVIRILSDDNEGSRHQRFIIRLDNDQTLLVAHNIDLAPRVSSLRTGDSVSFYGVYERNDKGGLIHWTHRDPQRRHVEGWIKHKGKIYQ